MKTKPLIELKNLKVAEFASEETTCYEATVWVDGKRFCIASNQGHGGPDSYDPIGPRGGFKTGGQAGNAAAKLDDEIRKVALRHNPNAVRNYEDVPKTESTPWEEDDDKRHAEQDREMAEDVATSWSVFEFLVGNALTLALYSKDMKAAMSKKWIFRKTPDGSLMEMKRRKGDTAERVLGVLREEHPAVVLLNALPADEALAIWRAN